MIEMLGVLAIIGVLSAGGIWGYTSAMTTYRTNKTIDDLTNMAASFQSTFSKVPKATYTTWDWDILKRLNIISDEIYTKKQTPFGTPLGIAITERVGASSCGEGEGFVRAPCSFLYAVYSNMPPRACIAILTHDWQLHSNIKTAVRMSGYTDIAHTLTTAEAEARCKEDKTLIIYFLNYGIK